MTTTISLRWLLAASTFFFSIGCRQFTRPSTACAEVSDCLQDEDCCGGQCVAFGATCVADAGDAGGEDAGIFDAGTGDAGPSDAGPVDAGPGDAGLATDASSIAVISLDSGSSAESPAVAVDEAGRATVVWIQTSASTPRVWGRRFLPSSGWISASAVSTSGALPTAPQVAVGAGGNGWVVWLEGTMARVYGSPFGIDGVFGGPDLIERGQGGTSSSGDVRIAVDNLGAGAATWKREGRIYWNRLPGPGGAWNDAGEVTSDVDAGGRTPDVAINPLSGAAFVVFASGPAAGPDSVFLRRSTSGVAWASASERLDRSSSNASRPRVAVNLNGNAIVVWDQPDQSTEARIWYSFLAGDAGAAWADAGTVSVGTSSASNATVGMAGNGDAVVLWEQDSTPGIRAVWASQFRIGMVGSAPWTAPAALSSPQADAGGAHIAVSPSGRAIATWIEPLADGGRIMVSTSDGGPFGGSTEISVSSTLPTAPAVASGPSDDAGGFVTWSGGDWPASVFAVRVK
ncbi:MAG: hypothetical protein HYY84_00955 [Deltaproteobacteria bacterium]|nr:hypothetical protein [Deltaproteobacteria bacterium]